MISRIAKLFLGLTVLTCLSIPAGAEGDDAGRKLGRGLANAGFGWIEILGGVERSTTQDNIVSGVTVGPVQGLGNAIGRTVLGVWEVATFPIPTNHGTYEPVTSPEFVLKKED